MAAVSCAASRPARSPSGGGVTRFTISPAVGMPSCSKRCRKYRASRSAGGSGLAMTTNAESAPPNSLYTAWARSLKPAYMPSNAWKKSARSSSTPAPVIFDAAFMNTPVPNPTARPTTLPAFSPGERNIFRKRPSRKSVRRRGASRKSRAFRVGGVSMTMQS